MNVSVLSATCTKLQSMFGPHSTIKQSKLFLSADLKSFIPGVLHYAALFRLKDYAKRFTPATWLQENLEKLEYRPFFSA